MLEHVLVRELHICTAEEGHRAWVDMLLHESHDEGGFGVTSNVITRHAAS